MATAIGCYRLLPNDASSHKIFECVKVFRVLSARVRGLFTVVSKNLPQHFRPRGFEVPPPVLELGSRQVNPFVAGELTRSHLINSRAKLKLWHDEKN